MAKAKLFINGRSQAVRLPKEYRFGGKEVGINKLGDMVVLYPLDKGWDLFIESLDEFSDDFLAERNQPKKTDKRKSL